MPKEQKEVEFELAEGESPREYMQRFTGSIEPDPSDEAPDETIKVKFTE
ncbi:MAG: hypothetical protein FWC80_06085 [Firmicutes bacterium]|nr:hypothetical protein [Bacillota bacterium]